MVPLKTTLTPAHLCSCSGTSSRVRDPACGMYLHDTPVHACHCSACLSTEHLPPQAPPAPDRPLSADEDAALGSPYSAHFRPHLFPSAPSHPVSTQASLTPLRSESSPGSLPPARGSPSFSATASRASLSPWFLFPVCLTLVKREMDFHLLTECLFCIFSHLTHLVNLPFLPQKA